MAFYDDELNQLQFINNIYQELDYLSKAAFFLHDALYKIARINRNEANSQIVREAVAAILSLGNSELALESLDEMLKIENKRNFELF
jgi:hypothetical protein